MNFDSTFPKRVALARSAVGMTQAELAKAVGVVQRQIAAYEGGEARPREKALINLAAALGTTVSWLTTGDGEGPSTGQIKRTVTVREVPLLTHVQVMGIGFDFDDFIKSASASEFIPAPPDAGEYAFALEVNGDSMTSPAGISFPEGTIIVVDPESMPESGDFGIFLLGGESSFTFKQYVIDQGKGYLKSLNPLYPIIPTTSMTTAIGKVISAQQSFGRVSQKAPTLTPSQMTQLSELQELKTKISELEHKLDTVIEILISERKPT